MTVDFFCPYNQSSQHGGISLLHKVPSDFVTWLCWLWDDRGEIIIDFPQTLSLGHVGYG
jgi:hypothetical protein